MSTCPSLSAGIVDSGAPPLVVHHPNWLASRGRAREVEVERLESHPSLLDKILAGSLRYIASLLIFWIWPELHRLLLCLLSEIHDEHPQCLVSTLARIFENFETGRPPT